MRRNAREDMTVIFTVQGITSQQLRERDMPTLCTTQLLKQPDVYAASRCLSRWCMMKLSPLNVQIYPSVTDSHSAFLH